MKLTPISKRFPNTAPGFNDDAAEKVFKAVMDCPDNESAAFTVRAIVMDVMSRDIIRHGEFLSKAYSEVMDDRASRVKDVLARQYVSKRLAGDDVTEIAKAAEYLGELISKAPFDYDRSSRAKKQKRGGGGRFVAEHKKIEYDSKQPVDVAMFNRMYGIKMPTRHGEGMGSKSGKKMSDREIRNWQIAYQEAIDAVGPYENLQGTKVHLKFGAREPQGFDVGRLQDKIPTAGKPHSVAVSVDNTFDVPSPYNFYQMGAAYGAPRAGARVQGVANNWQTSGLNPERLKAFNDENQRFNEGAAYQPGGRLFQRLNNGSALLEDMAGDNAPEKLKAALAAGKWVGEYGPEAQRALGPSVQRNAYRYRGVERAPDQKLTSIFAGINNSDQLAGTSAASKVRFAINGPGTNDKGKEIVSPAVKYFKNRLPNANLNTLQTASGNIPPSEGILIDKNGKVVTQAVGYGDDWYLPFNLKNVGRMKGGSYIRTRTFGGPTTEDVYTGLMSGASSLTVISHNGVYTMEFDDSFKGGRRYNDKAARMVTRYGQILDAVKSEQVQLDLMDPARTKEIRQEAARNVRDPDDPKQVSDEVNRLTRAERLHPKISEVRNDELKQDVLGEYADSIKTKGADLKAEDLRGYALSRFSDQTRAAGLSQGDAYREGLANLNTKLETPDGLIEHFGLQDQLARKQEQEIGKIRNDLSPLALNGRGYELALESLREQFPYYIKQPTFKEWNEGGGKRDSGYVKPRHIRPEAALAGYFDGSVVGKEPNQSAKITADSIATGKYRPGFTQKQSSERKTEPVNTDAGNGVGLKPTATGTPSASSGREPVPDFVKFKADRDLVSNLKSSANEIRDSHKWLFEPGENEEQRNLSSILNMSDGEIDDEIDRNPDGFNRRLQAAVAAVNAKVPALKDKLNNDLVENSRRRGAAPEARKVPEDPSGMLRNSNAEYDFGNRFAFNKNNTAEDVMRFAKEDGDVAFMMAAPRNLPSIDADDFDSVANEKIAQFGSLYGQMARQPGRWTVEAKRTLEREITGTIKAKQLKRRLMEIREETPAVAEAEDPIETSEQNIFVVGGDTDAALQTLADFQAKQRGQVKGGSPQITSGKSSAELQAEWDMITRMPDGPEKNKAINRLTRENE